MPRIVVPPPGPRSAEILARADAVLYPGLSHGLAPFVVERKDGWTVTDVDGNVYLDMVSASASVPFGAGRADVTEAAVDALRRYGNEDTHGQANTFVVPLAEALLPDGSMIEVAENLVAVQQHYLEASGKLYDPTVPDDGRSAGDGVGFSEFAGPCFSPDGEWLFVNIQVPGITCAITGDWASLGL